MDSGFLQTDQLQSLLDLLQQDGYECIGPQIQDGAIVYRPLTTVEKLPFGITETQAPGHYSINYNSSTRYFDWANGPEAIKPLLFRSREKLWQSQRDENGAISFQHCEAEVKPTAIIGARSCDIAAMKIHDMHFLQQQVTDPWYKTLRDNLLVVAVNCSSPADTCFCVSTGDGPFAESDYDLLLTELDDGFIIKAGSLRGKELQTQLALSDCNDEHFEQARQIRQQASQQQRSLPPYDIPSRLLDSLDSHTWHEIATKCLSCGNCTAVCPTCFCHSEYDETVLDGSSSAHFRQWDSCFNQGHSYIHSFTIRSETSQRYRQWLTHKFANWHEQYGRSGCVGCGRCTTWCPVGIDVTEAVAALGERRHDD